MTIDHIGYAVKDIGKAKKPLETLGYVFEETVEDLDRNIYLTFGEMDGYRVELVAPISEDSPVDMHLTKIGPTPYHICYKSTNIEKDIEVLPLQLQFYLLPLKRLSSMMLKRFRRIVLK